MITTLDSKHHCLQARFLWEVRIVHVAQLTLLLFRVDLNSTDSHLSLTGLTQSLKV